MQLSQRLVLDALAGSSFLLFGEPTQDYTTRHFFSCIFFFLFQYFHHCTHDVADEQDKVVVIYIIYFLKRK